MLYSVAAVFTLVASCSAYTITPRAPAPRMADIGDTGVSFENVAREWRCKYTPGPSGGPGDSESLKACQTLLSEYLPKLKALPGAEVTRQVCGGCVRALPGSNPRGDTRTRAGPPFYLPPACAPSLQMDFKVSITQPLAEHGEWAEKDYNPLESEFMEKLKAIEGTSLHETQEITFVKL